MKKASPFHGLLMVTAAFFLVIVSACSSTTSSSTPVSVPATGGQLDVVADTDILGDVVKQVGGDLINLHVLIPVGSDPHSYQPSPRDLTQVADAGVVFVNGAGLEQGFLDRLVQNAGKAPIIDASKGIPLHQFTASQAAASGEAQGTDPHVWMDPNNVMVWVQNIQEALSQQDPENAATYAANANAYLKQLQDLDAWIKQQVVQVPISNRKLVTDHLVLGYFASRYGFEQVGAIFPGYSSMSEPSAQDVARLEDLMRSLGVQAVFVGNTVNPQVAEQLTSDTGVKLVYIYTGSLTKGEPAATYIDYMHYNVNAIVDALK